MVGSLLKFYLNLNQAPRWTTSYSAMYPPQSMPVCIMESINNAIML